MKAAQAKKMADRALEVLSNALELGKSQQLTDYLVTIARFHRYSFSNAILIAMQYPRPLTWPASIRGRNSAAT